MRLVLAWLVAIAVYAIGEVVLGVALFSVRPGLTGDPSVALLWGALPALIIYGLVAAAAALVHRGSGRRHLLAVLPVPVAALIVSAVLPVVDGGTAGFALVAGALAAAAGTVAGWQAVDRLRSRTPGESGTYGL